MDPKEEDYTSIEIDKTSVHDGRRLNLVIAVPPISVGEHFVRVDSVPTPNSSTTRGDAPPKCSPAAAPRPQHSSSSKTKASFKSVMPGQSFKFRNAALGIQREDIQDPEAPSGGGRERAFNFRSMSFSKIFSPRVRTASLPLDSIEDVQGSSSHEVTKTGGNSLLRKDVRISRSQSVPLNTKKLKSLKRMDSLGGVFRVIPSTPKVAATSTTVPDIVPTEPEIGDGGEDIPEEEAVCRICMVELSEGSDTLKLECFCKGELALAHKDCAIKWFSIKGNRNCDVCKQEVQNLPVTLLRIQSVRAANARARNATNQARYYRYRMWSGMPILVIVSMLAYFCFLEQLLVADVGTAALVISLPFSCILGLFSSLTSTTMVMRKLVWIYAAIQFLLVVFFAHLFYSYLRMQSVISIVLATFAGFGVAMCVNSVMVEILRWRARQQARAGVRRNAETISVQAQSSEVPDQPPSDGEQHSEDRENQAVS